MKISTSMTVRLAIVSILNLACSALIEWKTFSELRKAGIDSQNYVEYRLAIGFTVVGLFLLIIGFIISFIIGYVFFCFFSLKFNSIFFGFNLFGNYKRPIAVGCRTISREISAAVI